MQSISVNKIIEDEMLLSKLTGRKLINGLLTIICSLYRTVVRRFHDKIACLETTDSCKPFFGRRNRPVSDIIRSRSTIFGIDPQ